MKIERQKRKISNVKEDLDQKAKGIRNLNQRKIEKVIEETEAEARKKIVRTVIEIVQERNKKVRKRAKTETEVAKREKTKARKEDEKPNMIIIYD